MVDINVHTLDNFNADISQSDSVVQGNKNERNYYQRPWSISKTEDELVLNFCAYCDATVKEITDNDNNNQNNMEIIVTHPYQEQAKNILYKINLADPVPVFTICYSTLSPKLKEELSGIWKRDQELFNKIIINSIKRLYESIDYHYFHTSGIGGKIAWAIVQ